MVVALSVTETVSFGVLFYAFTVFVEPMRLELGWSTATITGGYSLGLVTSGLMAPLVGRWVDRHGTRGVMTAGSLAAAAGVAAWSFVTSPELYYLVWAWLGVASALVLYEPAFALIAVWFDRRRGAALTVLTFIAGFASVIFIPLAGALVVGLGWRAALLVLAALLLVITTPLHALVLRRSPADVGQEVDGGSLARPGTSPRAPTPSLSAEEAFATSAFARLTFAFSASMAVLMALGVHLVPLLMRRGLEPLEAAAAAGAIGLVALPGRLIFTPLGSLLPRGLVTAAIFAAQGLGIVALLVVPGAWGVWLFVALYGAGFGAITPARAALVAESFGPRAYGAIAGRLALVGTAARAAAPIGYGALVSAGVDDAVGLLLALAVVMAAAIAVAPVGRHPAQQRPPSAPS